MEETPDAPCPRCCGRRLADGSVGNEFGHHCEFRPHRLRFFRLPRFGSAYHWRTIAIRTEWRLCLDCGLVWSSATDLPRAIGSLRHWGREDLIHQLGLADKGVKSDRSDLE